MERKIKKEKIGNISLWDVFDGTVENVLTRLKEDIDWSVNCWKGNKNYDVINIHIQIDGYYDDYDIGIYGERYETDAELKKRENDAERRRMKAKERKAKNEQKEAEKKAKQEDAEYQQFLKLKKKFES